MIGREVNGAIQAQDISVDGLDTLAHEDMLLAMELIRRSGLSLSCLFAGMPVITVHTVDVTKTAIQLLKSK